MGAWTGIAEYRVGSIITDFQQSLLQFIRFSVGYVKKALALPGGSAAKFIHLFRENHFVASLFQHLNTYFYQRFFFFHLYSRSHTLVDTAGEVDHFHPAWVSTLYRACQSAKFNRSGHMTIPDPDLFEGNNSVYHGHKAQSEPDKEMNKGEVLAYPCCDGIPWSLPGIVAGTEVFDHYTCIDGERTGDGTESVSGTGTFSLVFKGSGKISKLFRIFTREAQSLYFALHHNSLAGRKSQIIGQTVDLTEAALDTLIHGLIDDRHGFEMLQVYLRIV